MQIIVRQIHPIHSRTHWQSAPLPETALAERRTLL